MAMKGENPLNNYMNEEGMRIESWSSLWRLVLPSSFSDAARARKKGRWKALKR